MVELRDSHRCRAVVIDHHKSLVESGVPDHLESHVSRDNSKAGCELAWERFFPSEPLPPHLRLLSRYDVCDGSDPIAWLQAIVPFQYGMQAKRLDPLHDWQYWQDLFRLDEAGAAEFVSRTVREGLVVMEYTGLKHEREAMDHAFEARVGGYRAICINTTTFSGSVLESVWDPARHDLKVVYARKAEGTYRVSLYSGKPDVDVGELAKRFGGGGHMGAAGFCARSIDFRDGQAIFEPA